MNLKQARKLRKEIYVDDLSPRMRDYRYTKTGQRVCVSHRRWYQAKKRDTDLYKLGNLRGQENV